MAISSPFHAGELQVQQLAGEAERATLTGQAIGRQIIPGAIPFIHMQPMLVVGSVDPQQQLWASVLFGAPGFMTALPDRLHVNLTRTCHNPLDPLWKNLSHTPRIGTLIIELASRKRIRINGQVDAHTAEQLTVQVDEAYPNCPKYIQARRLILPQPWQSAADVTAREGSGLEPPQMSMIGGADTFFVASAHPTRGVDVSHRGGRAGFVQVVDDRRLRIPDFVGNSMFNTLGNFHSNPNAGLVFLDFDGQRMVQLTGRAEVLWDVDDQAQQTGGTRRWWMFTVTRWQETIGAMPVQWAFEDASPHNPGQ